VKNSLSASTSNKQVEINFLDVVKSWGCWKTFNLLLCTWKCFQVLLYCCKFSIPCELGSLFLNAVLRDLCSLHAQNSGSDEHRLNSKFVRYCIVRLIICKQERNSWKCASHWSNSEINYQLLSYSNSGKIPGLFENKMSALR
jgi:hypothetical protein